MGEITIPPRDRIEWEKIVTGKIEHQYSNFVLQMKVHQACKDVTSDKVSIDDAVDALFEICKKYTLAVQADCKTIFKTW